MSSGPAHGSVFILGSQAHYQVFQSNKTEKIKTDKGKDNIYKTTSGPQTHIRTLNNPIVASQIYIKPKKSSPECGSWMRCGTIGRHNSDMEDYHSDTVSSNLSSAGVEFGENRGLTHRFNKRKHCQDTMPHFEPKEEKIHIGRSAGAIANKCAVFRAILSGFRAKRNRKRKLSMEELDNLDPYALRCSYKDSCRCLDCQCRYFECDDDDSEYGTYSLTDDSVQYLDDHQSLNTPPAIEMDVSNSPDSDFEEIYDDDDVFIDETIRHDHSTSLWNRDDEIAQKSDYFDQDLGRNDQNDVKLSIGSESDSTGVTEMSVSLEDDAMELEMAAGTPVFLDFLLNHPLTCCIM